MPWCVKFGDEVEPMVQVLPDRLVRLERLDEALRNLIEAAKFTEHMAHSCGGQLLEPCMCGMRQLREAVGAAEEALR